MFDIGFPELMLVAVVMLLVLGPERLPEALRAAGLWLGRLQRSFTSVKAEIEREIGMDEVRRQLHNEGVMAEMKKLQEDLRSSADPRFPGTGEINSILPEDSLKLDYDVSSDTPADNAASEPGPEGVSTEPNEPATTPQPASSVAGAGAGATDGSTEPPPEQASNGEPTNSTVSNEQRA